jgi:hypothetical protein
MTQLQEYIKKYNIVDNRDGHLGQRAIDAYDDLGRAKVFLQYVNKVTR